LGENDSLYREQTSSMDGFDLLLCRLSCVCRSRFSAMRSRAGARSRAVEIIQRKNGVDYPMTGVLFRTRRCILWMFRKPRCSYLDFPSSSDTKPPQRDNSIRVTDRLLRTEDSPPGLPPREIHRQPDAVLRKHRSTPRPRPGLNMFPQATTWVKRVFTLPDKAIGATLGHRIAG